MKGVDQLVASDPLSLVAADDIPIPKANSRDIVIKVSCAGVNRLDLIQADGKYSVPDGTTSVLGLEASGIVLSVGSECTRGFKERDEVFALLQGGGYAEMVAVDERCVFPAIKSLSLSQNASISEAFLTAYQLAFFVAKAEAGQSALVHAGASSVGRALIQVLVKKGVNVIATTRSRSKIDVCLRCGASDAVMPVSTSNSGRDLIVLGLSAQEGEDQPKRKKYFAARAIDANGGLTGAAFDMVFCPVGGDYLEENVACLKTDGKVVLYGLMGGTADEIDGGLISKLLFRRISLLPSTLRSRSLQYKASLCDAFRHDEQCGYPAIERGDLKVEVEHTFPLEDVLKAHSIMRMNRNVGKIVLMVSDQTATLEWFSREMKQLEKITTESAEERSKAESKK